MSASVLDFIDVQITRDIQVISQVGFGTLLFIGETEGKQPEKIASYTDIEEVGEVFDITDPEYLAAQVYFSQVLKPERLFIGTKEDGETYAEALNAVLALNDDWYALAIQSRDSSDVLDIAAAIQPLYKIYLAASSDADLLDPNDNTDVGSALLDLNRDRTALIYHSLADGDGEADNAYPEVAWAGRILPLQPGTATWAWKTLSGIPSDSLSKTVRDTLTSKRVTFYVTVASNNVTFEGQTSAPGIFLDLVRGSDWLTFRIAEDIVARLTADNKIPYIGGDAVLEQLIRGRLDEAVERDVIAPDYSLVVPPASQQSANNRANRIYDDIIFEATATGAVHRARIRGSITV